MPTEQLSEIQIDMLRLVRRSPDIGEGWRQSGPVLWPMIVRHAHPELVELDNEKLRVRLSHKGETLLRFAF